MKSIRLVTLLLSLTTELSRVNGIDLESTCQILSPHTHAKHLLHHATFDVQLSASSRIPPLTACFLMGNDFERCIQPNVVLQVNSSHHLLPRLFHVGNLRTSEATFRLRNVRIILQDSTTNHTLCETQRMDVNSTLAAVKLVSPTAGQVVRSPNHVITLKVSVVSEDDIHIGHDAYLLVYCQGYPPERLNIERVMHSGSEGDPLDVRITLRHAGHVAVQVWMVVEGRMDEIVAMTDVVDLYLTTKMEEEEEEYEDAVAITACRYGRMIVPTNDEFVGRSLLEYGEWAEHEVALFRELVRSGDVVLDVGANIGAFTLPLSSFVKANGTVLSYEPQRALYNHICGNLALNGLTNVFPFNLGLGSHQDSVLMNVPAIELPSNLGGFEITHTRAGDAWASSAHPASQEIIQIVTLDKHLEELQIKKVDFIKIDVEGMELDVLRGGEATLIKCRPIVFYENDRLEQHAELYEFFKSHNYAVFWVVFNLFNPDNYKQRRRNVFPQHLHSYNALAIPMENNAVINKLEGRFQRMSTTASTLPQHPLQKESLSFREWHSRLKSFERRMYSQNGEDGVLFEVFNKFGVTNKFYVEIGAGDGDECNTRFFREWFGWEGIMLDAAHSNEASGLYQAFVTAENVVTILEDRGVPLDFDLLSLDIDMNDYWILRALIGSGYSPRVMIVEVNAALGPTVARTVQYKPERVWNGDDFHGGSLAAFCKLLEGYYSLLYCESHGVNCIFIQSKLLESYRNVERFSTSDVGIETLLHPRQVFRPPRYFGYDGYLHPAHVRSRETEWVEV